MWISEKLGGVLGVDAAAIENCPRRSATGSGDVVDQRHDWCNLVEPRRNALLANGPNGLVRDDHLADLVGCQFRKCYLQLNAYEVLRAAYVANRQWLANADQRDEAVCDRSSRLECHYAVCFAEMLTTLRVANLDQGCASVLCHPHGDLTGPRALFCPVGVLRAEQDR